MVLRFADRLQTVDLSDRYKDLTDTERAHLEEVLGLSTTADGLRATMHMLNGCGVRFAYRRKPEHDTSSNGDGLHVLFNATHPRWSLVVSAIVDTLSGRMNAYVLQAIRREYGEPESGMFYHWGPDASDDDDEDEPDAA